MEKRRGRKFLLSMPLVDNYYRFYGIEKLTSNPKVNYY